MSETGTVYIVGAGPGDPGLITVKGLDVLRKADVVIYDRLAAPELLREARSDAELINAGKAQHQHTLKQDEINALLIDRAKKGLSVVRLKGGDPFVFGRGAEEALVCRAADVPFVIVPGVSSAIAVPAYAGIPVTHRDYASAFTVFTGHENPDKPESTLDFDAIVAAARAGTLVLLMGAIYLPGLVEKLLAAGIAPDAPAVCIEWGTTPKQRVVQSTLEHLVAKVTAENLSSPAITVIGEVVRLRDAGLAWF